MMDNMAHTQNVKDNLMDILKPVFGDVPVPKGAIEEQVKRLWIMEFGGVSSDLLQQTSNMAKYEFEKFPTRKQYHDLLIRVAAMQPVKDKPKSEYELWLEEVNARQEQTKKWMERFEPELHEKVVDRAIEYYIANDLCYANEQKRSNGRYDVILPPVNAMEKLKKIIAVPEEDRNAFQKTVVNLLRSTVIDHLLQEGRLADFEKKIGL